MEMLALLPVTNHGRRGYGLRLQLLPRFLKPALITRRIHQVRRAAASESQIAVRQKSQCTQDYSRYSTHRHIYGTSPMAEAGWHQLITSLSFWKRTIAASPRHFFLMAPWVSSKRFGSTTPGLTCSHTPPAP